MGTIAQIKEAVALSPPSVHIAMNAIGIWKGNGRDGDIDDNPESISFIASSFLETCLSNISSAFEKAILLFPSYAA
jgi:hypothetical protein